MDNNNLKRTETANRTYQDSLFRMLFSTKDKIIELYNALEDTDYGPDTEVEITTLEDVLYIDRKKRLRVHYRRKIYHSCRSAVYN